MNQLLSVVEAGRVMPLQGGVALGSTRGPVDVGPGTHVEWYLYHKCSTASALKVLGRAFALAADCDHELFVQLRAEPATVDALVYPKSKTHGWQALCVRTKGSQHLVRLRSVLRKALDKIASDDVASRLTDTRIDETDKNDRQTRRVLETTFNQVAAEAARAATQPENAGARIRVTA